jgi:hypothetical protein
MAKKNDFDLMGVVMAMGGGVAGGLGMDLLEDKIDVFKDKPMLAPLVMSGAGLGAIYFGGDRFAPIGYGILGASGSEMMQMAKDKMDGFSRVNYQNTPGMDGYTLNAEEMASLSDLEDESDDQMTVTYE